MALKNTLIIGALLISLVANGVSEGQTHIPSPSFGPQEVETADSTRPFAAPGVFDYDTRVFAPLEFTNGKEKAPNTGFFFSLDKTYTSVSKASRQDPVTNSPSSEGSDYIWGTRYEFGWFSDDDDGWGISYQNANGTFFTNGQDAIVTNPTAVVMDIATVEANRLFRQALPKSGYFEPYIGVRYVSITDRTLEDTAQLVGGAAVSNRFNQRVSNDAFGLQVGAKYNKRRGRWRTSFDGTLATTYNQQRYFASDISSTGAVQAISETNQSDQSFVPIIDGQFDVAYNISRDISIRTGVQVIYTWDGVARANTETTNLNPNSTFGTGGGVTGLIDESHVAAGVVFGVEWRR